ncbi:MAG: hypothetical protein LKG11_01990 [Bacilli bacterium]|jgi:hypothetical protein|nr:hypothetical protein [Bacilli bacterium]
MIAAVFSLAGCGNDSSGVALSSGGGVSSGSGIRPEVATVLRKFSNKNGFNSLYFSFVAAGTETDSGVTPKVASATVAYLSMGYEVHFTSGWDEGKETYGYLNMPSENTLGKATGVYRYGYDGEKALTLGESVSTSVTDVYDCYATPKYLYDNASTIAPFFAATSRSEIDQCDDVETTVKMAKALNVYGVLASIAGVSFSYVQLQYSASSTSYKFSFFITYNGVAYLGARATLSGFGSTKNKPLTDYVASIAASEVS